MKVFIFIMEDQYRILGGNGDQRTLSASEYSASFWDGIFYGFVVRVLVKTYLLVLDCESVEGMELGDLLHLSSKGIFISHKVFKINVVMDPSPPSYKHLIDKPKSPDKVFQ
jgi:hypothetical protein